MRWTRKASKIIAALIAIWLPFQFYMTAHTQGVSCMSTICSGGGGGVAAGSNTTFTGDNTFSGSNVASGLWTFGTAAGAANAVAFNETAGCITFEGSSSDTIQARLCATNPTTGDRTFNIPLVAAAGTSTLVTLESPQTFSGNNTHSGNLTMSGSLIINNDINHSYGAGSALNFQYDTSNTPDTMKFGTGTASNAIQLGESADINSDLNNGSAGTAAAAHPQLNIYSAALSATEYRSNAYWGTAGRVTKTIVDATLTSVFQVGVADNVGTGGNVTYSVFASDGTAHQLRTGELYFSAVNEGGTETCATPTDVGTSQISATTGTLTCTFDCDEAPTNAVNIQFNCNTSLTPTTMEIYYQVTLAGPGQITPQ